METNPAKEAPRSLAIAQKGLKTSNDLANLMSALMSDIISGRVTPSVANAACRKHYKAWLKSLRKP